MQRSRFRREPRRVSFVSRLLVRIIRLKDRSSIFYYCPLNCDIKRYRCSFTQKNTTLSLLGPATPEVDSSTCCGPDGSVKPCALTINVDTIGQMSCNPAIGGLAKGHLAREIDALGGEMGKATDLTGLQFRMLNTKKGPAVWAPRAQCDKKAYQFRLKWICEREPNLDVKQGQTSKLLHADGKVFGVETTLEVQYHSTTVIITTGTFLRGLMHIGQNQQAGGRAGESAAMSLSGSLQELGLELGRLTKTQHLT